MFHQNTKQILSDIERYWVVFSPCHLCFPQWGNPTIQPFYRGGGLICGKATIRHRYYLIRVSDVRCPFDVIINSKLSNNRQNIQFNSFRNLTTLLLENIWNQISLHRTLLSSQPLYLCRVTMVTSMHKMLGRWSVQILDAAIHAQNLNKFRGWQLRVLCKNSIKIKYKSFFKFLSISN